MTQRRAPSGQGPARRPVTSRTRTTGAVRKTARPTRTTGPIERKRRTPAATRTTTKRTVAPRPRALTGRATVLLVVFVALGPPLDDWSDHYLLLAHMVQHLLLIMLAATAAGLAAANQRSPGRPPRHWR